MDAKSGLLKFFEFIGKFKHPILVAQNGGPFDSKRLMNNVMKHNLKDKFLCICEGFADTLPLFRAYYPDEPAHGQENLTKRLLGITYEAHNALSDVQTLVQLVKHCIPNKEKVRKELLKHSFSIIYCAEEVQCSRNETKYLHTYNEAINSKLLTDYCATKLAKSGLSFQQIKLVYDRDGQKGVHILLSEKDHYNKSRIGRAKSVAEKLANHFALK